MKHSKFMFMTILAAGLVLSACSGDNGQGGGGEVVAKKYTYRSWTDKLGDKWDPFTWETAQDSSMLDYLVDLGVDIAPLDTDAGSWQWVNGMFTNVVDVSNDHKQDLVTYGIAEEAPEGDIEGYVYEIDLRQGLKWEHKVINNKEYGTHEIKAGDFIESAKLLLEPARNNYRANLYFSGETAIANAYGYFNSGKSIDVDNSESGHFTLDDFTLTGGQYYSPYNSPVYINYGNANAAVGDGDSLFTIIDMYRGTYPQYIDLVSWDALVALDTEATGLIPLTESNNELFNTFIANTPLLGMFGVDALPLANTYYMYHRDFPVVLWDNVGIYKVNDYKFRYVCANRCDANTFKVGLTSTWLVETELYNDLTTIEETTQMKISTYNSDFNTSISYGPYKLTYFEDAKQAKFTQNEYWWGWTSNADGSLTSTTEFLVNGAKQPQYQSTDIVIDVLTPAAAKLKFEKGELNDYTPTGDELPEYSRSAALYKTDTTYTFSFFFNNKVADLQALDSNDQRGDTYNSVVLSNDKFRKAMSLAINRNEYVLSTPGWAPAYSLMNNLYYYDLWNDPTSMYRKTDQAMKAIVDLYGIEYGEGTPYPTLKDAYESVTGYNLSEAKQLFTEAYNELRDANLIPEGANIGIEIAWSGGELDATVYAEEAELNRQLNQALTGTGFGTIALKAVGNLVSRHARVPAGEYAMGYGAWGGAAMYPFRNMQVYMDNIDYEGQLNESACWNPSTEQFTINIDGSDVTMTYQDWSRSCLPSGPYGYADPEVKLTITAALENSFLGKYYRIPLAAETECFLLGYQQHYFTEEYNVMYGFGGSRLMVYDYDDVAWADYVASQGGTLNYK